VLWFLPLAGAAIGAMANKKNPMKGALMGAGIGATGGLLAPAALGAGAAAGAGAAGAAGAGAATGAATGAAGLTGASAGNAGLMYAGENALAAGSIGSAPMTLGGSVGSGTGLLGMSQYAKPAMDIAQKSGLLGGGEQQPIQPAQMQQVGGGSQTLAALAQQGNGFQEQLAQAEQERRKRRQGLLGGMA
jgi:hypothetical protein